jgi:hypothetical protein
MKLLTCTVVMTCALLTACGPSEQKRAELAEKRRIECLDTFCEGDVEPLRDKVREVALKLNGQWYVGPKAYFSGGAGAVFYWPSKTPEIGRPDGQPYPEKGKPFYHVAIEIFLRGKHRWPAPSATNSWRQHFEEETAKGNVIESVTLSAGLEMHRIKWGPNGESVDRVYVALNQRTATGEPAVIFCREVDRPLVRCTGGELWQPDVYADFRFSAAHAADWPEIHQEITRVLNLLKKASS